MISRRLLAHGTRNVYQFSRRRLHFRTLQTVRSQPGSGQVSNSSTTHDANPVSHIWESKGIDIIGVPLDLGAGRRGVDMGPSALRLAKLNSRLASMGFDVNDKGNVNVPQKEERRELEDSELEENNANNHVIVRKATTRLSRMVEQTALDGRFPLVLGGDHSIAAGSLSGVARARAKLQLKPAGLIWIDAHADMNTPDTSPSGNLHGMPLASLLGLPVLGLDRAVDGGTYDVSRCCLIGIRDVDQFEKENMARVGLIEDHNVFPMSSIDRLGMNEVVARALNVAAPGYGDQFVLSYDVDALDPDHAPGVGTPVPGGISFRESHLALELLAEHGGMVAMDLVEVNPVLDHRNNTAEVAVEMICSAMGLRTL